jgi:UDP-N-acetylmuramyl pentapeptide phosphotransferase/UDP-N-acetylglucosamine-1-phosphate transferase
MLGLFAVSLLDDIYNLPVKTRLFTQFVAATVLLVGSELLAQQGLIIAILVLFMTVWIINLYNFMDGSDGLAGGMALFGFSSYGIAALLAQDGLLAWTNFTIAAAALAFLLFNFHPAKIFMGDSGSIPLGFLAVAMGVWGVLKGDWFAWFPLLVFSPFIFDATTTLIKRFLRGDKVTEAHREHYYQRAIQMGWGHGRVALAEYVLMAFVGACALLFRELVCPWVLLLVWGVLYAGFMMSLDRRWSKFQERVQI